MRYLALIYSREADDPAAGSAEDARVLAGYGRFAELAGAQGALESGHRLRPVADATTVRVKDGKTVATDGPFAETREQLGGFYILNCETRAEAIKLAAMIPAAQRGSIELRPVWEMGS